MSSSTLFFDPDLRVRREDHSDGLLSWLAAINPQTLDCSKGSGRARSDLGARAHRFGERA